MAYCSTCGHKYSYCSYCGNKKDHNCKESNSIMPSLNIFYTGCNCESNFTLSKRMKYCSSCGSRVYYDAYTGQRENCDCKDSFGLPGLNKISMPLSGGFQKAKYCTSCGDRFSYCSGCGDKNPCSCSENNILTPHFSKKCSCDNNFF